MAGCLELHGRPRGGRDGENDGRWLSPRAWMEDVGACEEKAVEAEELKILSCWRAGSQDGNFLNFPIEVYSINLEADNMRPS